MFISMFGVGQNNTTYFARIRRPVGWGINPGRPLASRQALDGHSIHQTGAKDYSTAAPSVTVEDSNDVADQIDALDKAVSTAFVSDGVGVYEAVIDATITDLAGRRKSITVAMAIVRKVF